MNSKSNIETMQAKMQRLRDHIEYSLKAKQKQSSHDARDTKNLDAGDNLNGDDMQMAKAFFAGAFAVKVEFARGFKPSELPLGVEFYAYGITEEFMLMSAFYCGAAIMQQLIRDCSDREEALGLAIPPVPSAWTSFGTLNPLDIDDHPMLSDESAS